MNNLSFTRAFMFLVRLYSVVKQDMLENEAERRVLSKKAWWEVFLHACSNVLARIKDRKSEMKQGNFKMKQTEVQVKASVGQAQ